jgi:hypothetical protein
MVDDFLGLFEVKKKSRNNVNLMPKSWHGELSSKLSDFMLMTGLSINIGVRVSLGSCVVCLLFSIVSV